MTLFEFDKRRAVSASFKLGNSEKRVCKELQLHLKIKPRFRSRDTKIVRLMQPVNLTRPHPFFPPGR